MLPFPEIEKIAEPPGAPPLEQAVAWWWWAGAIVLGIMAGALVVWVCAAMARRAGVPAAPVRPEKLAWRELKALRKRADGLHPEDFGAELSGIVRSFLHRRVGMPADFATTGEILGRVRRGHQPPPHPLAGVFQTVLEGCDALKFSGVSGSGRQRLLDEAEAAVKTIMVTLRRPPQAPPAPHVPSFSAPDAPSA